MQYGYSSSYYCMSPTLAPPIAASLILPANNIKKNPAKIPAWEKKIRQSLPLLIKFNRATAGGTVNLHASQFRLKQRKVYSHPPSPICLFPISPSIIPPSPNPPSRFLGQFDHKNTKNSSAFRNNDRNMTGIWQDDRQRILDEYMIDSRGENTALER